MPKFRVKFEQYVQEIAEAEVYATSSAAAKRIANELYRDGELDLDWSDGSGALNGPKAVDAEEIT